MSDFSQNDLDKALAGLSKEIHPPRNLWPQIAGRIEARRKPRPILMAACVAAAAACVASVFTWAVLRKAADPSGLSLVAQQHAPVFGEPTDAKYLKARADLEKTFNERLALLDPGTRLKIEASLQTIRNAREDIRRALQADPASSVLEDLWQGTAQDELDLYDHVVQTTDPSTTRS